MTVFEHKKILDQFEVQNEAGTKFRLLMFTTLLEVPPRNDGFGKFRAFYPRETIRIELSNKRPVNRIDDDTFQEVVTGEILKRVL